MIETVGQFGLQYNDQTQGTLGSLVAMPSLLSRVIEFQGQGVGDVDRLTKSAHFLVVRMTFTLEEFCRLYIGDSLVTWSSSSYNIGSGSQVYSSILEKFSKSHENIVDDEHCFSSLERQTVGEDHTGFGGHAEGMRPRSQG